MGGGGPEISIFQVLNMEDILQDTLEGGSNHCKDSTYTGENKNTKISDMNQLVFETHNPHV
jgi:hypothetical protein